MYVKMQINWILSVCIVVWSCLAVVAVTAVHDYLNMQNRPYSAVDIFNNLHKEYGKVVNYVRELISYVHRMIQRNSFNDQYTSITWVNSVLKLVRFSQNVDLFWVLQQQEMMEVAMVPELMCLMRWLQLWCNRVSTTLQLPFNCDSATLQLSCIWM